MSARSHRVVGPAIVAQADAVFYTVPTDRVLILKTIILFNRDTVARDFVFKVNSTVNPSSWYRNLAVPANTLVTIPCYYVFNDGDVIYARATNSAVNSCEVTFMGSLVFD